MCSNKICKYWSYWLQLVAAVFLVLVGFLPLGDYCLKSQYYAMFDEFFGCWMILCTIIFALVLASTSVYGLLLVEGDRCTKKVAVLSVFLNLNIIFLGTLMFTYSYHELEEVMKATMKFYGTDYKVTTVWKAMESNLNCSGVNSSLDWKEIKSNEFVKDLHGCLAKLTYEEANLYGFFAVIFAFLLIVKLCCWRPCVECVKMSCFGGFTATSVESLDCPNLRSAATNEDVASSTQTTSTTQTIANPHYVVNLRKYGGPTEI